MQSAILLNDPAVNQKDLKAKDSDNKFKIFAGISTLAFIIGYVQLHMQVQYQQDVLDRLMAGLDDEDQDMMANSLNLQESSDSLTLDISNLRNLDFVAFEDLKQLNTEHDSLLVIIYEKVLYLIQLLEYHASGGDMDDDVDPPVIDEPTGQPMMSSAILTPMKQEALANLFSESHSYELAYRASRDGFDRGAFHSRVNGVGNTLTIAKNLDTDNIFGGFTDINIMDYEVESYLTGNGNSWQFFFDGQTAHKIAFQGTPCEDYEIYQRYDTLISWRDGLWIQEDCDGNSKNECMTWFQGKTYEWPDGCDSDATCGGRVVGDSDTMFYIEDIETWIVRTP